MKTGFYTYLTTILFLASISFNLVNSIPGYTGAIQVAVLEGEAAEKPVKSLKEMPEEDFLYFKNIFNSQFISDNVLKASFYNPNSIYFNFCPLVLTPPPDSIR